MDKKQILKYFIIIQPILDLITSLQSIYLNLDISLSLMIRGISFILVIIYFLFLSNNKIIKNYMILISSYIFIYLLNIYFIKGNDYLLSEIYTFIRFFYFPIMLVFIYSIYKEYKNTDLFNKQMITYITLFYFLIASIAFISNTSFPSYMGDDKIGYNGWFYSANERGNTYAILLPYLFIFFIKDLRYIGLIILGIFAMLILGTKVGFMAVIGTLVSALIYFMLKKITIKNNNIFFIGIISTILITILLLIQYLPFYKNIELQNTKVTEIIEEKKEIKEEIIEIPSDNYNNLIENKGQNLIYSGREIFFKQNKEYYLNQSITNKLIGYGLENKYIDNMKISNKVEIDIIDILFCFGLIGFILYFLPLGYLLYKIIRLIPKKINNIFESSLWFKAISILLALGISFFAGHIFVSPSVSIYLILSICSFYFEYAKNK